MGAHGGPVAHGRTEGGVLGGQALGLLRLPVLVGDTGMVQAVDGVDGEHAVALVAAVGLALGGEVGDLQQGAAVSLHPLGEGIAPDLPEPVLVHQQQHGRLGQRDGERPLRIGGLQRLRLDAVEEVLQLLLGLSRLPLEGAGVALGQAVLEEGVGGQFEALRLPGTDLVERRGRVQGGVEHELAHPLGVEVGVGGTEVGAVGVAEVVELLGAHRGAQHVHVAGGGVGVEVGQQLTGVLLAALGDALHPRESLLQGVLRAHVPGAGQVLVGLLVAEALDAGRAGHTAGVEADDVVGVHHRAGEEERGGGGEVHAGAARAAGVQDQGSGAVAGGGVPCDGQVDVPGPGVVPHHGHGEGAAFQLAAALHVIAGAPGDVLLVVGGVGRVLGRVGGQVLRGGGAQRGELLAVPGGPVGRAVAASRAPVVALTCRRGLPGSLTLLGYAARDDEHSSRGHGRQAGQRAAGRRAMGRRPAGGGSEAHRFSCSGGPEPPAHSRELRSY